MFFRNVIETLYYTVYRARRPQFEQNLRLGPQSSGVPRNFFGGVVQQIQLRTEDRENGDLGVVAP